MRCIAVINQKGGVGKTTSTVNIGAALAKRGNKVLLLDIDPQANLSLHLDRRPEGDGGTMTDLLVDGKPLSEMITETGTEGLCMVPAETSLSGVETMLANRIGRETILREAIEALDEDDAAPHFDYILLDCPPSLGVLSANALVCADEIIIPMQAEYFSMQGMTKLMEVMQLVKHRLNPELSICLILPCMVDRRTNLTNEVLAELRQHFGDVLAETCIRSNVKLAEAPSFGRTIFEHAPESNGAHDYDVVTDELLSRFAGTFEAAPLEGELGEENELEDEDEKKEDELIVESTEEGSEVVELVAAGDGPENKPAAGTSTDDSTGIVEKPIESTTDTTVGDGAPFVESVPPTSAEAKDEIVESVADISTQNDDDAKPDSVAGTTQLDPLPDTTIESVSTESAEVPATEMSPTNDEASVSEDAVATNQPPKVEPVAGTPATPPEPSTIQNGSSPPASGSPTESSVETTEIAEASPASSQPADQVIDPVVDSPTEQPSAPIVEASADAVDESDRKSETSAPELQEGSGA